MSISHDMAHASRVTRKRTKFSVLQVCSPCIRIGEQAVPLCHNAIVALWKLKYQSSFMEHDNLAVLNAQ